MRNLILLIWMAFLALLPFDVFAEGADSSEKASIIEKTEQAEKISGSDDINAIFKKGNEYYIAERYGKAEKLYNSILDKGFESPEVYFNLGNTYFRLNNIPKAILLYERAKKLIPQDEDLLFNLSFANKLTVDNIKPKNRLFVFDWIEDIRDTFSSSVWAAFIILFVWIVFIAIGLYLFLKKRFIRKLSFIGALISLTLLMGCIYMGWQKYELESSKDGAIIFEGRVNVKHSPEESAKDFVVLHEGTKVEILDEIGEWKKIKLADGNVGWVFKSSLEII